MASNSKKPSRPAGSRPNNGTAKPGQNRPIVPKPEEKLSATPGVSAKPELGSVKLVSFGDSKATSAERQKADLEADAATIPVATEAKTSVRPASRPATRPTPPRPATRPGSASIRAGKSAPPPPPQSNGLLIMAVVGVMLLALGAFVAFLIIGGGNSTTNSNPAPGASEIPVGADAAAQVQTFPNQGRDHLTPGQTVQQILNGQYYNSDPPTSGPHLPTWSDWGVFTQPVQNELQVHNLEHGGIVIQYDCSQGCAQAVNNLSAYARRYSAQQFTGILLAPRSNLPEGSRIAVTAWTHRLLLKSFDRTKIEQFITAYIGKGPESDGQFRP